MDFLSPIFFFTLAIAVVVGFHEYGHFIAARLSGVKVDVFSIGMGPTILARKSRKTGITYQIAALPIGGYVKMWESTSVESILSRPPTPEEESLCFDKAPVHKRFFIVANGPFFNFVLAVIGYAVISHSLTVAPKPIVGNILPESIMEEAGFQTGDQLHRINGKDVSDWEDVALSLSISSGGMDSMPVHLKRGSDEIEITLPVSGVKMSRDTHFFDAFGFYPIHASGTNRIVSVSTDSIAKNLGLLPGDEILSVGSCKTPNLRSLVHCLDSLNSDSITLTAVRDGAVIKFDGAWQQNTPLGVSTETLATDKHFYLNNNSLTESILSGVERANDVTFYTVESIYKLLTGKLSPELVGGPVTLAKAADSSASHGLYQFINFLCVFSISLMVLNLIPVPPLDGGHLFLNLVEVTTNKTVADRLGPMLSKVGIVLIGLLMIFAIGNDFYHEIL